MTFKIDWEHSYSDRDLSKDEINTLLQKAYHSGKIDHYTLLRGGCSNTNIKVQFTHEAKPILLRIYLRDPQAAYREQKITQILASRVPVPQITAIDQWNGYTFAIMEYIPGISLRDLLLSTLGKTFLKNSHSRFSNEHPKMIPSINQGDIERILFDAGILLAKIASVSFHETGFFDENLSITEQLNRNTWTAFARNILTLDRIKSTLTENTRQSIHDLLDKHKAALPDRDEKNLVHADFDPANIIVQQSHRGWQVSGILDWEFSFSGPTLHDVATMLRYAHHMPPFYEASILAGLNQGGYILPQDWRLKTDLLNLISLLDCLKQSTLQQKPHQIRDICDLIEFILLKFTRAE